ncbi:MAG: trehalose-6-phosphate synthase [Candidatus Omnitrophota bacterium]|nr:trehalose-6-phosphate synthase [Candidatus Omnitrophota bacterium]
MRTTLRLILALLLVVGAWVVGHDVSILDAPWTSGWPHPIAGVVLQAVSMVLAGFLIIRWGFVRPMARTVQWMRRIRMGEPPDHGRLPKGGWRPLTRELIQLARSLTSARASAEEEARLRLAGQARWTAERLKEHVRSLLGGRPFVVVANREPYLHVRQGREIRCLVPASGLVTAVEPILRACGGIWVAHGSGEADRDTADHAGRLRVPPEAPAYTLKRVWLDKREEEGYYYGFSNEGLWPLCHIAHTRPVFRAEDWAHYQRVNTKFMEATLEELEGSDNPCLLIQDYHFALLPRLIKARRPDAKIALFWHIPWPNPEAFDICPWARELLHGMLGADLLGFHIQFHCNNFLDTVDRTLESRIDWEQFAVNRADHTTRVRPFPISIAFQEGPATSPSAVPTSAIKEQLRTRLGLRGEWVGVGVDRIDYTKGIMERLRAVERLLDKHPSLRERFTFLQIGAPSRTLIQRYHDLGLELDKETERINQRFQTRAWRPIVLLKKQHSHEEIMPFYQGADVCLVTSLHDGMNLVAKEFVAARTDQRGALILSRFTGASRELRDALLVNPYDIDQVADAIYYGLTMDPEEQQARMSRMRETLQEHNVYRWAAHLVTELATIRPLPPPPQASPSQDVVDSPPAALPASASVRP